MYHQCVDRWSSSLMGRPLAIADADCDIELPHVNGGTNGRKDYSLFINFIKLSSILGQILRCIYSPKAKAQGYNNLKIYQTVQGIHQILNDWLMSIPESHRILPGEVQTWMTTKASGAGPLMVCYQVVLILLYRTFLVPEKDQVYPELYKEANTRCTEAAKTIVDVGRRLQQSEVIKFGWNFTGKVHLEIKKDLKDLCIYIAPIKPHYVYLDVYFFVSFLFLTDFLFFPPKKVTQSSKQV